MEHVLVRKAAVEWLMHYKPVLCEKAGLSLPSEPPASEATEEVVQRPLGLAPLSDNEEDGVRLWSEIHRLRAAVQGPAGFATWQDAAVAERVRRVAAETALRTALATQADALRQAQHVAYSEGYAEGKAFASTQAEAVEALRELVQLQIDGKHADECAIKVWERATALAAKGQA